MITLVEPTLTNKALIDSLIIDMKAVLKAKLNWLDYSLGKAQKMVRVLNGQFYSYPAIYVGGNEYFDLGPNDKLGNFCFFDIQGAYQVPEYTNKQQVQMTAKGGVVFWVDLSDIYPNDLGRALERVKAEAWRAVMFATSLNGTFKIDSIYDTWEDVYRGYALKEEDGQYLMHPYAAFRIDGEFKFSTLCRTA